MRWIPALLVLAAALPAAESPLDRARKDAEEGDGPARKPRESRPAPEHHHHDGHDQGADPVEEAGGALLGYTLLGIGYGVYGLTTALPRQVDGDEGDDAGFQPWPWADATGWALPPETEGARPWAWSARAEWSPQDDGIDRWRGEVRLDHRSRFGLRAGTDILATDDDHLDLIGLDATYRLVHGPRLMVHTGLGLRTLVTDEHGAWGGSAFYGKEIHPVRPVILSLLAEGGWLEHAGYGRLRATAGAAIQRFEIYGGWDALVIGDESFPGPVGGIAVRF
jgi:hypothetical protein